MPQTAPLILTPLVISALEDLRARAAASPVNMVGLAERLADPVKKRRHMLQMTAQSIHIPGPFIFSVTFSLETGHPVGVVRHLSVSVDREGRVPSPGAVEMIARYLGFVGSPDTWISMPERLQGHGMAITVIQPVAAFEGGKGSPWVS